MSNTIQQMKTRGSVRSFDTTKKISKETLDQILSATQQSPTSIGGQQYSIIVIEDEKQKDKLLELTMPSSGTPQQHIKDCSTFLLFIIDYHKLSLVASLENTEIKISNHFEGAITGTVDVGIAVEAATVAAESLGLGTVMIGAVRRNPAGIIKEFNLPSNTFPIVGLCIGHPLKAATIKPRLPKELFAHYGQYTIPANFKELLNGYNKTVADFYKKNGVDNFSWTNFVANFYNKSFNEEGLPNYKKQGLDVK